ncbi:MAG: helix-turn-helix domain-containing protein [Acidimicrobiales bacterium]
MAPPDETDGRRQRSVRTRAAIVDAAARMFVDRGYVATTIEAVAELAGVATQTVYYVFNTKRNLLAAVLDASIAGDVEPLPVLDRSWVSALGADGDAATAIDGLVAAGVAILARAAPVYEVVRRASADAEVGLLLDENRRARRTDQQRLVEILEAAGHLRPGLAVPTAADIVYGVLNEEVFQLLTVDCGWDLARFEAWVAELLRHQLT